MDDTRKDANGEAGSSSARWRILCIDDEPDILSVLKVTLAMRYEVVTAQSGLEALRIIAECEPDFVICDVRMPVMDGYATVLAIRQHADYVNIPVFFLTAERGSAAARRGFESGCSLYLTKPFDAMRLLENIDYFTKKSGHTIRSKSRTLAELENLMESLRRTPVEPVMDTGPRPAPSQPEPPPPPPPEKPQPAPAVAEKPEPIPATPAQSYAPNNVELHAEHEAFLADRKRREREHWKVRYAEIQEFIDRHS